MSMKMNATRIVVVLVALLSFCHSFSKFGPAIATRGTQSHGSITPLFAAAKPLVDLSVDDIAARWRVVKFGQGPNGYNGIELADRLLSVKTVKIPMSRVGGLGLDLMEYNVGKGDLGLILVGGVIEGSNAEKCGMFLEGDALEAITTVPTDGSAPVTTRLEGLNFDSTVAVLGQFSDYDSVAISVKRVFERGEVIVQMVGPQGEDAGNFTVLSGMGANLRTALNSQNIKFYDDRTYRFDSPFQTGNCGGDGTCGTCVVAVLAGKDLMNERVRVEDGGLKNQLAPPNYRWACRIQIAPLPEQNGIIKIKLRPQTASW